MREMPNSKLPFEQYSVSITGNRAEEYERRRVSEGMGEERGRVVRGWVVRVQGV